MLKDESNECVHANVDGVMSSVGRQVMSFFHEQPVKGMFLTVTHRKDMGRYPDRQLKGKPEHTS